MEFKLDISKLKRTNFAHPSEWSLQTTNQEPVKISYRCGEIKIFIQNEHVETTSKDEWDIGGYMEDEELIEILKRDGFLVD